MFNLSKLQKSCFLISVLFGVFLLKAEDLMAQEKTGEGQNGHILDNFDSYEPIYFLLGNDPFHAKIQISFRYQVFRKMPGLNIAYTQKFLWDLDSFSKPFKDTNFLPQVFYRWNFEQGKHSFDIGAQHQSNGRSVDSRSLNILYARGEYAFFDQNQDDLSGRKKEGFVFNLTAQAWTYVLDLTDNPDIRDFRGNTSLEVLIGHNNGLKLRSYVRGNLNTGKGSMQFDLSYPIPGVNFYLHGQIFTGYGDMLINYKEKETKYRLGLSLVR